MDGLQAKDELMCFISWPYLFRQRARERGGGRGGLVKLDYLHPIRNDPWAC